MIQPDPADSQSDGEEPAIDWTDAKKWPEPDAPPPDLLAPFRSEQEPPATTPEQ